jgi:hypothetical protein
MYYLTIFAAISGVTSAMVIPIFSLSSFSPTPNYSLISSSSSFSFSEKSQALPLLF